MKNNLRILSTLIFCFFAITLTSFGQDGECETDGCLFGFGTQRPATTVSTSSATFAPVATNLLPGNFSVCAVTSGTTYEWSLCPADGGVAAYDAQMTLYTNTNAELCYSDDLCGLNPKIRYVATFTGTVKVQINVFDCIIAGGSVSTLVWRAIPNITDVAVAEVYSLSKKMIPNGNPHTVSAAIQNNSTQVVQSLGVSFEVSGANTFSRNIQVTNLGANETRIVNFESFSSANPGTNTITVRVVDTDDVPANNVKTITQNANATSFAYTVGTTPVDGLGFNTANGEIGVKFKNNGDFSIAQANVFFNAAEAVYRIKIYDATGTGGLPGAQLFFSAANRNSTLGLNQIPVSPAVPVSGDFWVVVVQQTTTLVNVGCENENPLRTGTFYFKTSTVGAVWTDIATLPTLPFRLMFEVVAGCAPPAQPDQISGATSACSTATNTYSVAPVQDATSYTWTLPNGWTGSSTSNTISATAGSMGGNISVSANSTQCGSGLPRTLAVTVNPTPIVQGPIRGESGACAGASLTYSVATVPGATAYTWTLPAGWGGTSTTNSISTSVGSSGGTISVTATGSCGTSSPVNFQVSIVTFPSAPANIAGFSSVCSSTTQTYTAAPVAGAASYIWTLPAGWSGTSTSNVINATVGTVGGNIQVRAINSCGQSNATSLAATVNPTGNASFTYATNSYCVGSPNPSATLTSPGGIFSASPTGLIFTNPQTGEINLQNSNPGSYTVTYTTAGACSTSASSTVTIAPTVSASFAYGATSYCLNSQTNPGPNMGSGASLGTFSATPAGLNLNAATGIITLSGSQAGSYTITNAIAATAGCSAATANATVAINAAPTATVAGGAIICSNGSQTVPVSITFTGTPPYNFTYAVGGNPTPITGYASNSFIINAAISGTYTVTTVQDATTCQSPGTGNAVVTINQNPAVSLTPFQSNLCLQSPGITLSNGSPAGGTYSGPGVANNVLTPATAGVGTHTLTYTFVTPQNCTGSGTVDFVVEVCVSNKPMLENSLQVWPNPASNQVSVSLEGMNQSNTRFTATTMEGRSIDLTQDANFTSGQANISVEKLPKGLYQLMIHQNGMVFKKMISIR